MHQQTRIETRWGLQTGLAIGFVYALVTLLGYWISPSDYERHAVVNAPLVVICFLAAGALVGLTLAGIRHAHADPRVNTLVTFAAGVAFSASALATSHGGAYLTRGAHWLVVVGIALAAPSLASMFWSEPH